jgi:hypothetical protein
MLHELYALEVGHAVSDFLITTRSSRAASTPADAMSTRSLIAEADGRGRRRAVSRARAARRPDRHDPPMKSIGGNLADFWSALEGVSHFTYYAWNAARDKTVSLFELELQAEVDKFVTTGMLLREQTGREPSGLHAWLFDSPTLAAELAEHERERYRRANRYAAKYCRRLEPTLAGDDEAAAQRAASLLPPIANLEARAHRRRLRPKTSAATRKRFLAPAS